MNCNTLNTLFPTIRTINWLIFSYLKINASSSVALYSTEVKCVKTAFKCLCAYSNRVCDFVHMLMFALEAGRVTTNTVCRRAHECPHWIHPAPEPPSHLMPVGRVGSHEESMHRNLTLYDPAGKWLRVKPDPTDSPPFTGLWLGAICHHRTEKLHKMTQTLKNSSAGKQSANDCEVLIITLMLINQYLIGFFFITQAAAATKPICSDICPLNGNVWLVYYEAQTTLLHSPTWVSILLLLSFNVKLSSSNPNMQASAQRALT